MAQAKIFQSAGVQFLILELVICEQCDDAKCHPSWSIRSTWRKSS